MPARTMFLTAAAVFVAATLALSAQDTTTADAATSAPIRAARLVSAQGSVTVTDGNNPPAAAQTNLPLLAGVQIATGADGQAEIEFEDGSIARLTPNSALSLDKLDIAPGQLFVTDLGLLRGLAYFELRATPEYVYSVNAGGDLVSPVENATLRIDFDEPPASIAVLDGTAQVQRANGYKVDVVAGSTLREDANDSSRYSVTQEIAADSWDQWNADMDQQEAQQSSDTTSVRNDYAGAQGYGWSDLDNNGTWYNVPGQGQVWQPYVADEADFDPYGAGAWTWYPGAGYVWASAYPWGWTPYRCGAWSFYDSFGWGWAPGIGCGGYGWGFAGGGFVVNIVRWPRGYRPVHVPIARPGPVRPIIPVRTTTIATRRWTGPAPTRGPRQIAGLTAQPIAPGHMGFVATANAGAALHRDFPIDRATHAPALGLTSTRSPNVYRVGPGSNSQPPQNAGRGQQNGGPQPNGQPIPSAGLQAGGPGGRTRGLQPGTPATANVPAVTQPNTAAPIQRQQPQGQPDFARSQHTEPQRMDQPQQPPQRQTYTPQPQHTEPVHPQYQPAPRQNFSPPPQPQRYSPPPQPRYSPPPPPPQPHYSPPPPPPHVSSPPPSAPSSHR